LSEDLQEQNNLAEQFPDKVREIDSIMSLAHQNSEVFAFPFEKN